MSGVQRNPGTGPAACAPLTSSNDLEIFPETAFGFPHLMFVSVQKGRAMSDLGQSGSPDFYREKAAEALRQSQEVTTEEARVQLVALAEHWQRLAQVAENPSW